MGEKNVHIVTFKTFYWSNTSLKRFWWDKHYKLDEGKETFKQHIIKIVVLKELVHLGYPSGQNYIKFHRLTS